MKVITILIVVVVVVLAGGLAFLYAGAYNIGADAPHWPLTVKLIDTLRERSIETRAAGIQVPADLNNPKRIMVGAAHYAEMCTGCHLTPGQSNSEIREGLYPTPPNLTRHRHDPAEEFWIIKHGIKLTGMPAWGKSHSDDKIWAMVAFLQKLPSLTPAQYQQITKVARQADHDADEGEYKHGHEHRHDHGE